MKTNNLYISKGRNKTLDFSYFDKRSKRLVLTVKDYPVKIFRMQLRDHINTKQQQKSNEKLKIKYIFDLFIHKITKIDTVQTKITKKTPKGLF